MSTQKPPIHSLLNHKLWSAFCNYYLLSEFTNPFSIILVLRVFFEDGHLPWQWAGHSSNSALLISAMLSKSPVGIKVCHITRYLFR
ncbi:hypothetical protein BDV40DRAFT_30568 [Aspergillus tamarii]|uniref:Uncharacterized protein n=1 Tax=Aspergillus tamarii TaxID=41984 RepID=A0A5N6V864_ASPTM|nr:hypothetical protein BDV40DRAFT_30568 [Aspergillus tamarii]